MPLVTNSNGVGVDLEENEMDQTLEEIVFDESTRERMYNVIEHYTGNRPRSNKKKKKVEIIKPCDLSEVIESDKKDTEERKNEKPKEVGKKLPPLEKVEGEDNVWTYNPQFYDTTGEAEPVERDTYDFFQ